MGSGCMTFDGLKAVMTNKKELAYRYDLIVTPEWRERFDQVVSENFGLPDEGRFLFLNCGTGSLALEVAQNIKAGEVYALDPIAERLEIARAKAQVKKLDNVVFEEMTGPKTRFSAGEFDAVIADASLINHAGHQNEIEAIAAEMLRVSRREALLLIEAAARGTFDEFFSIYWEALHDCQLEDEALSGLEQLINARPTVSEAEELCRKVGFRNVQSVTTTQEFVFESGSDFIESPLIKDTFLDEWLSIVRPDAAALVRGRLVSIIDQARGDCPFDVSVLGAVISGAN